MKCKYSLTFEFDTKPPITEKGEISANAARTIFARAVDDAVTKNPSIKWSSIVVVIDRVDIKKDVENEIQDINSNA